MKKNVLSLSIAAMIGGLGFAGRQADDVIYGCGYMAPLFDPNETLGLRSYLVTQDTPQPKAARVRFRSEASSDDILDFAVFLSPGDTWTATVAETACCSLPTLSEMSHLFKEHHHGIRKSP